MIYSVSPDDFDPLKGNSWQGRDVSYDLVYFLDKVS